MVDAINDSARTSVLYLQESVLVTPPKTQASQGNTATQGVQNALTQVGADPSELDQLIADMTAAKAASKGILTTSSVTKDNTLKNSLTLLQGIAGSNFNDLTSSVTAAQIAGQGVVATSSVTKDSTLNNDLKLLESTAGSQLNDLISAMNTAKNSAQGIVATSSVTKDSTLKNSITLLEGEAGSQFDDLISSMAAAKTAGNLVQKTKDLFAKANYQSQLTTQINNIKSILFGNTSTSSATIDGKVVKVNETNGSISVTSQQTTTNAKTGVQSTLNVTKTLTDQTLNTYKQNKNYQSQLATQVSNIKSILFGNASSSSATISGNIVSVNEANGSINVVTPQTTTNAKTGVQYTVNMTKTITGQTLTTYKQNQGYQSQLATQVNNIKSILFGNTSISSATIDGKVVKVNEANGNISVISQQTTTHAKTGVQSTLNVTKTITSQMLTAYKQNQDYQSQLSTRVGNIKSLLFGSSSSDNDFIIGNEACQGSIGDCYLITGLNGLNFSNNFVLKSAVASRVTVNEGNGSINVTFQRSVQDKNTGVVSKQDVTTVIDVTGLQAIKSKNYYASNAEVFTNVLERGYAQFRTATRQTTQPVLLGNHGGNTSTFLSSITGKSTYLQSIYNQNLSSLENNLQQIVNSNGRYIVAADSKSATDSGIVGNHAYLVKGYDSNSKTVKLINPWDSSRDVNLSLATFQQNFTYFDGIDTAA